MTDAASLLLIESQRKRLKKLLSISAAGSGHAEEKPEAIRALFLLLSHPPAFRALPLSQCHLPLRRCLRAPEGRQTFLR